jgi:hypothetical protein
MHTAASAAARQLPAFLDSRLAVELAEQRSNGMIMPAAGLSMRERHGRRRAIVLNVTRCARCRTAAPDRRGAPLYTAAYD